MNTRLLLTGAGVATALMGCAEEPSEQVWAFYLGVLATDTDSQSLSHNFTGAFESESGSDWTSEGEQTESDSISFGEIVGLGNGQTLLVLQNRTFLGSTDGTTTTYSWDRFSEGNSYESHEQGYVYTHDWDDHVTNTITLTATEVEGTNTGDWTITSTTDDVFNEDDTWDSTMTGQTSSQVPATTFLVTEDNLGNKIPASNLSTSTDCDSNPCSLSVTTTFVQSRSVTAVLTDYTADELDRNLETSGQQAGL